jgi:hypothetical protein
LDLDPVKRAWSDWIRIPNTDIHNDMLKVEEDMSKAAKARRRELEKLMKTVKVNVASIFKHILLKIWTDVAQYYVSSFLRNKKLFPVPQSGEVLIYEL